MTMHCLQIPEEAFAALKFPPDRAEEQLRQEFAVFLVREGLLGVAQAKRIAQMDRVSFQTLLAQRRVDLIGSVEDALHDAQSARAASQFGQQ